MHFIASNTETKIMYFKQKQEYNTKNQLATEKEIKILFIVYETNNIYVTVLEVLCFGYIVRLKLEPFNKRLYR